MRPCPAPIPLLRKGLTASNDARLDRDLAELNVSRVDLVLLHAPCSSDATNAKLWRGMEQALALNLTRAVSAATVCRHAAV